MPVIRRGLLGAVRDRMRHQAAVRETEPTAPPGARDSAARTPPGAVEPDPELTQLAAEARYHRERFELYHARVISGSRAATSPARLRELERTATAAQQRLTHAKRAQH